MIECIKCEWDFEEYQLDSDTLCGSCSEFGCRHNKLSWNCEPCTNARQIELDKIYAEIGK